MKNLKNQAKNLQANTSLSLSKILTNIKKYLFKVLYLDKIDKNYLIVIVSIVKLTIKVLVITNLIIAFLLYASKLLDVENPYTWEIIPLAIWAVFAFFSDMFIDCKSKLYQFFRYIFEKFINSLNEIKYNYDKSNNLSDKVNKDIKSKVVKGKVTMPAKETYKFYKDSGKINELQFDYEKTYYNIRTIIAITTIVICAGILFLNVYGYYNYSDLSPNFKTLYHLSISFTKIIFIKIPKRICYDLPKNIYKNGKKLILKIFRRGGSGGGTGSLPMPATTPMSRTSSTETITPSSSSSSFESISSVGLRKRSSPTININPTATATHLNRATFMQNLGVMLENMNQPVRSPRNMSRPTQFGNWNGRSLMDNIIKPSVTTDPRLMGYKEWLNNYLAK